MKKTYLIITILLIIALLGGWFFWSVYLKNPESKNLVNTLAPKGFNPFNRNTINTQSTTTENATVSTTTNKIQEKIIQTKLPVLRRLSNTPVGGMSASTTASTTLIRFIDRGTGHVYEGSDLDENISKLSNTTLPRIYESYWNKNLNAFILRYLKEDSESITNFYAEIRKTGTTTSMTPFEIKGKYLSTDIDQIAVSPTKDKIFTWNIENGRGIGYISTFDEKNKIKIIDTPINQVLIDWPENNTVIINTKPLSSSYGYLYSIDVKTGTMKKIIGGLRGLSTKISSDMTKTLFSISKKDGLDIALYNNKNETIQEVIFKTLADKCVWSTLRKGELYCAVPTDIPSGIYPDDWYKGKIQFIDRIWHLDTVTEEVHLLANPLTISNELIDATQLTLDPKENFLYFINKRDLSLWSLDLNQ